MLKKLGVGSIFALVLVTAVLFFQLRPVNLDELTEKFTLAPHKAAENSLTVQWLGNTNVVVSDGVNTIMTDGWFTRPSVSEMLGLLTTDIEAVKNGIQRAEISQLDAVIPIHSHFDHVMDAPAVAEITGATLIGSVSSANVARGWGLPEEQIEEVGDYRSFTFGAFTVEVIRSKHYEFVYSSLNKDKGQVIKHPLAQPARIDTYVEGGAYAVLVSHPQGTVLINGSAGYLEGVLQGKNADIGFIGIAGIASQTKNYRQSYWYEIVETPGVGAVVPIHWDSFVDPLGDKPVPPAKLVDGLLLQTQVKAGIQWLMDKAASQEKRGVMLPMWEKTSVASLKAL